MARESASELHGVIPITATPFDTDGRVDEDSIVSRVEFEPRGQLFTP